MEGMALAGSLIQVIPQVRTQLLRLLYDYEAEGKGGGREIQLYQTEKRDLTGRFLAISEKETEAPEVFQVSEMTDQELGLCLLGAPLRKSYKKAGTTVFPVYTAVADVSGGYFLYLPGIEGMEGCPCQVRCQTEPKAGVAGNASGKATGWASAKGSGTAEQTALLELRPGQGNRVDFV